MAESAAGSERELSWGCSDIVAVNRWFVLIPKVPEETFKVCVLVTLHPESRAASVPHLYSSSHTEPTHRHLWPRDLTHLHQLRNTCCHYYHWHATSMIFSTICFCCCFSPGLPDLLLLLFAWHKSLYYPVIVVIDKGCSLTSIFSFLYSRLLRVFLEGSWGFSWHGAAVKTWDHFFTKRCFTHQAEQHCSKRECNQSVASAVPIQY